MCVVCNSQADIHESSLVRCCLHDPGFSQRLNSKCNSAEDLSIIGVETVEVPLPINSLDSHHTQRKQDEVLD